ncbi:MAG: MFS transporter [Microlunatus sp.]
MPTESAHDTDVQLGTGIRAYGRLLTHGPIARPFIFAALARLTLAMLPLGILILVQQDRQTYALAGVVSGAYAIGAAVGTPLWGRLMDRFGQVAVLSPTALSSAGLLVALALATTGGAPGGALVALAAGVGLAYPAVSPALRAGFRVAVPDPSSRKVAFALDTTSVELSFVLGPLLLSGFLVARIAVLPLLITAILLAGGTIAYCLTRFARRASRALGARDTPESAGSAVADPPVGGTAPRTALAAAGVPAILIVVLLLSVGFGQLDTSMTATADQALGGTEQVGILFAAIAGGSTIGGLVFGARSWPFDDRHALPVLMGTFSLCLLLLAGLLSTSWVGLPLLLPLLFVTGLSIAPALIMQQTLLDRLTPPARLNEAQALLSASNTTGAAIGTAIAGFVIEWAGLSWSFTGAAIGVLVAGVLAASRPGVIR